MRILKKLPITTRPFLLIYLLIVLVCGYELTLTNNANFQTNAETFLFNNRLIWDSPSTFYLVQIYNHSTHNLLAIDQTNNNNISNIGNLQIDNLNPYTFFITLALKNYLAFIYDLQTQNGNMGSILIVHKTNFTLTDINPLYASYVAAIFLQTREVILAVTTYNSLNIIINPENINVSSITGPILTNNWVTFTDISLTKSVNENYILIFSLINEVFELLSVNNHPNDTNSLTIIQQNLTNVNSVCFFLQNSIAVHQNQTLSFYSLPQFTLLSSEQINLTVSSECYLDTITGELIFVYEEDNETIFWAYNTNNSVGVNTFTVTNTNEVILKDSQIYVIGLDPNSAAVSFSFFDYQSCHRAYAYDSDNFICYNCPSGCNSCNSSQFCYNDCLSGNYFIDDYCCGNSQYYQIVTSVKHCYNCPVGCYNCTSSQFCITCLSGNYFIDDYCCGNSQYYLVSNATKHCYNCPVGCYNCNSSLFCITCKAKNYFIDDYCCGVSQYYVNNGSAKSCYNCPNGCYNCSTSQFCYSCTSGNQLLNNYCCSATKYLAIAGGLKSCNACPSGCYNCSNLTYCYTCTAGKILMNNYCCSSHQYVQSNGFSNASCVACPLGCSSCSGASICSTCSQNWMMGIDSLCYNSTQSMPTGEEGNPNAIANKAMTENGFLSFFNSLPSIRGILKPIFGSFVWFDEIYLFQFHERDYGMNMELLFKEIQAIQKQKWGGANWLITDRLLALFSTNINNITVAIDYKSNYTSTFWKNRQHNGQGFLVNSLNYLLTITVLTLGVYLLIRVVFYLLYKHRWSMFFRSYSFWPYLMILLMEGNILQLIFFSCGDLHLSFSLLFSEKIGNIFAWACFFVMIIFSTALFPLLYSAYHHRIRSFSDNLHIPFRSMAVVYLAIELGFRHLLQGMIHYFFKDGPYYQLQFSLLMTTEVLLCGCYIFFISKGCFNYKFKIWLSVLQSFSKIVLLFFLFLRMKYLDVSQLNYKTNKILGYVTAFYIAMIYVNLAVSCLILIKEVTVNVMKRLQKDEEERLKKINQEKDKAEAKAEQERLKRAQQTYTQVKIHKTVNQDRSFFFKPNKPQVVDTNIVKVVRIKRGHECQ